MRCDIDEQVERPEARRFDFDPVDWARERHPQLVVAACTSLRAYLLAKSPWGLKREPWGGFEQWDKLVSGCLTWLGYADPYATRDRVIGADPIRVANADLLSLWHAAYGDQPVSLRSIRKDGKEVYEALLKGQEWDGHHAQWILRKLENKVINGYRLVRLDGQSRFCVECLNKDAPDLKPGDSQGNTGSGDLSLVPGAPKKEPLEPSTSEELPF